LGEFERGKTTFVNALLGAEMLPVAALLSIAGALVLRPRLRVGR
jgi:hypothetical protein